MLRLLAPFSLLLLLLLSNRVALVHAYKSINPPAALLSAPQHLPIRRALDPMSDLDAPVAVLPRPKPRMTTNAERLARGLPILRSRFLSRREVAAAVAAREVGLRSPSRIELGRRSSPSNIPDPLVTRRGFIEAFDADSKELLGLVSATPNNFGEYGLTPKENEALAVTFSSRTHDSHIDILIENSPFQPAFPNVGCITGFASTSETLGPGSSNYGFIAGTQATPPESKPMNVGNSFTAKTMIPKSSESAVWSFDSDTRVLSPTWVNPDGSNLSPTDVAYTDDVLVITGDLEAFRDDWGGARRIMLKFRPN